MHPKETIPIGRRPAGSSDRSVSLSEPERIYPLPFIAYLSRFLLAFDDECQAWWYAQARAVPPNRSKEDVERIRLRQFGQFAASVKVVLIDFEGGRTGRRGRDEADRLAGATVGVLRVSIRTRVSRILCGCLR